jgi:hypothetical protein
VSDFHHLKREKFREWQGARGAFFYVNCDPIRNYGDAPVFTFSSLLKHAPRFADLLDGEPADGALTPLRCGELIAALSPPRLFGRHQPPAWAPRDAGQARAQAEGRSCRQAAQGTKQ